MSRPPLRSGRNFRGSRGVERRSTRDYDGRVSRKPAKDLRVGDPERERAIALLGEHLTAGRLDIDEYEQRCFALAGARFASEITAAFDDLPAPHPEVPSTSEQTERTSPSSGRLVTAFAALAMLFFLVVMARQVWLLPVAGVIAVLWFTRRGN